MPRFHRFEGPRQQQLTFRTAPVVIGYPNGDYESSGDDEPYDSDAVVLRTEVEVFNGTDQEVIVCRHVHFLYTMPPERCVFIEIASTTPTRCGDYWAPAVQTLSPGQGARYEACGVIDEAPTTTTVRALHLDAFRDEGYVTTRWAYDSELWTASELPVVSAPAFPVWRGSYPRHIEGRLEIRPASEVAATYRAGEDEAGWIVSLTFSVKNATDVPLVLDTASVRVLLEAPQTEAWTARECGQAMERLDPLDRALRALAPGEIVEQRFAWWAPRSRFDGDSCLFETPTRVQLRLPGEPAVWLPVRP